jgi:hypothetical protein
VEAVANCNNDLVLSYEVSSFVRSLIRSCCVTSLFARIAYYLYTHFLHIGTHGNAKLLDIGQTDDGIIDAENTNTLQGIIFHYCHA